MVLKGHVVGLQGCYAVGWAHTTNPDATIVQFQDANGRVVATGRVSDPRPDLAEEFAPGNHSFRILLGELRETRTLRALVDGIELSGSPLVVGPGYYDGELATSNGCVHGWITERTAGFEPPIVRVIDQDAETICEMRCEFNGDDTDPFYRPARFQALVDSLCFGQNEIHLRALVNDTQFASANVDFLLCGSLEIVTLRRCAGWLTSPNAPDRKFVIEFYRDGDRIATAKANRPRADLRHQFPNSWQCGFDIVLPAVGNSAPALCTLSARLQGSKYELFGGPFVLGDTPAAIVAARKAAALSLGSSANLSTAESALVRAILADYVCRSRGGGELPLMPCRAEVKPGQRSWPRLDIVIPVYRDVDLTRACIESVLAHRSSATDRVVLVNDCSPEVDMVNTLCRFELLPNVTVLTNDSNLGLVKSINRALRFCRSGAVVLLNSDTRVFAGAFDEMWSIANSSPDIGTVTAMSNKATIFSYPHWSITQDSLSDVTWEWLAAVALAENSGSAVDVPTAHGFCMLITRRVLQRVGFFDEVFGRGYGEENDFCSRAADLGFRNVAAGGVFVEHRESVSFGDEKLSLRQQNLDRLSLMYPEYMSLVHDFARRDPIRCLRWPLDIARFRFAAEAGRSFVLLIHHRTGAASGCPDTAVQFDASDEIRLVGREDGYVEVSAMAPLAHAVFAPDEVDPLFYLLSAARPILVVIHHVDGFAPAFAERLATWVRGYRSIS